MAESRGFLGLKVLYEGSNPCVDIIAVHGLGASPDWAWIRKVDDGNEKVLVNWLADEHMLPAKLPNSRIMTFNYESKWFLEAPKQRRSLCAIQLLTALGNQRTEEKNTKHRPLIFIGHSFGGVVIEQSLVSANSGDGNFHYLASSTVGVIFLGTPHRGTQAGKWGEYVAKSGKVLGFGSEDSILEDLREDSKNLRDLLYDFTLWANRASLTLICFFEQHMTDYGKRFGVTWKELVVDETSACIDGYRKVPLPTDHLKINKYSGSDDPSYIAVYPLIVALAEKAIRVVQDRLNPQTIVEDNSRIPNENLKCLQSLFLSNPQDDLAAIRSAKGDRVDGTCEWILTQDRYTSWLNEDSPQLLWLSGSPGIGKTMLSSFLVEELAHLAECSSHMTLAYYFCDDKDEKRRTATAILRGILLQLLRQRPSLFKHIQSQFAMSRDSLFSNFHALWSILVSIVQDPEAGEVCCLIDALDECDRESRQLFLDNLTKLFCSQQSKRTFVKFVVASRLENDIEESLSTVSPAIRNIQIDSGKVNKDLSKFIDVKVDELSTRKKYRSDTRQMIKHALTEKAGGTFLYVSLVLDDLKTTKTTLQVRQRLQKLPPTLNNVYDRILGNIDADCVEVAKLILGWVAVARRPLTVGELAMVLTLGTEEWKGNTVPPEDVLDELKDGFKCCEPLICVDTAANAINLVHQSAKDYLLGRHLQDNVKVLSQYHVLIDRTNLLMFRTCWKYLSFKEFEEGTIIIECNSDHHLSRRILSEEFLHNHCFLRYAREEWDKHALAASPALAIHFGFRKDDLDRLPTFRDSWLIRAAAKGQEEVVLRLLQNGAKPESTDNFATPLSWAAMNGHEAVVKLLLNRDDVTINVQNQYGETPLSLAAKNGHQAIVKLLLNRDDIATDFRNINDQTPLSWAARTGQEAVVKLLLNRNDVAADSQDWDGETPLILAAKNGHAAVVQLLLNRDGVAVNRQNQSGETPLSLAAKNGHEAVVKLLLNRNDVTINCEDHSGRTPLFFAAKNGHETIVKLLLNRDDVAVNPQIRYNETPLSFAVRNGHQAIVKLLLNRDDIAADFRDIDDQTPLSWAARTGQETVVKLLLNRNDVAADSQDIHNQTPLSWAAERGCEAVMKLLLDRNDVAADSKDKGDRTPLSRAAEEGHEAVIKLLLDRNDVAADSKDKGDRTPLSRAAEKGHEAVVKLLLDRNDVVIDSKDKDGRTPLSWAVSKGYEAVVKLLLDRNDVVTDSQDIFDRTPLSWAARRGHEAVVKQLLNRKDVAIDSKDKDGRTPLSWAVYMGHEAVVKQLLNRKDVAIDNKDKNGRTPLSLAAEGYEAVVKLLLDRNDVAIDSKDNDGHTPLWFAIEGGYEPVVKILEQRMRDVGCAPQS